MGMRFRKSIKIAPGIRLSATQRGLGVRVGGRGGGISFSPSGTRVSAGIPGTGLSWSERISSGNSARPRTRASSSTKAGVSQQEKIELQLQIVLDDATGEVQLLDGNTEQPLNPSMLKAVKQQQGEAIRNRLEVMVQNINETRESLAVLHADMQAPIAQPFIPTPFAEVRPADSHLPVRKFLHLIWPPAERRRQQAIELLKTNHHAAVHKWEIARKQYDEDQESAKLQHVRGQQGDLASMEALLEKALSEVDWPYETLVAWEFVSAHRLMIDIDFPEIEMLPARRATLAARGLKVNIRKLAARDLNELYARHVSSIGVKLAGVCFQKMTTIQEITLSGYSQRLDRSTGHERDDYLYSVRLTRDQWQLLNFEAPGDIDAFDCLGRFEIQRKVLASWVMKPIEPFQV